MAVVSAVRPEYGARMGVAVTPPPSPLALAIRATRPLYLPTSVLPALAGALVAIGADGTDWWLLPVVLVATLIVHAAVDVTNEVEDAANDVDSPDKMDNSRVFSTGLMSIAAGRRLYAGLFAVALALGMLLCAVQTWWLLPYGLAGIVGGWLYTGGPRPYKYDGLGDPAIVWLMGPLLTQGAYTSLTGDAFHAPAFWAGLFPGLLITAVLEANNLSDIPGDSAVGVRTLAVRTGFARARVLFLAVLGAAYVVPPALLATGLFGPWILLPLATLPLAAGAARQALSARASGDEALVTLAPRLAQTHLLGSVLLAAGIALDRI
jgi:1,4-dihydroxy-2-naphthoate octaprenyltransferase